MANIQKTVTQTGGQQVTRNNFEPVTHKFDQLKMYFGEPYDVGNGIIIRQPTVGEILDVGEAEFYATLYVFIANPTTYRLQLWDIGIDWNKITSYDLFAMLVKNVNQDITKILFGDFDFSGFESYMKTKVEINEEGEEVPVSFPTLYDKEKEIELTKEDYTIISEYLRTMFNIFPKVEKIKGKATKESVIEEDRMNLQIRARQNKDEESGLLAMVSACVNHPGFKYKLQELKDVGICQFMDSVQRLQVYESSTAMLHGMMGGFVDSSKIQPDAYNWMRSLNHK